MAEENQNGGAEFKPGDTIRPANAPEPVKPVPVMPVVVAPVVPVVQSEPHLFKSSEPAYQPERATNDEVVSWTASEFIDHAKSVDWYLALGVIAVLAAAGLYFLFHDVITSISLLVAALAFGFYGRRQPRQLQYKLDSHGLTIGTRFFPYNAFRSFAVTEEGPFISLAFLPLKRFGMFMTVYLDPQDEDRALDLINHYLPMEPPTQDMLDRFLKRIRF